MPDLNALKIVHVTRTPVGGIFRHILDVAGGQAARGHNVGIVSEPTRGDRSFQAMTRRHDHQYLDPEVFLANAPRKEGSWWPEWVAWLNARSGTPVTPAAGPAPEGPLRLAFIGRWTTYKGNHTLVAAAEQLADHGLDFSLTVLGAGEPADVVGDFRPDGRKRVTVVPSWMRRSVRQLPSAWASVLQATNSTPSRCAVIMLLIALPPAPPTPTTVMRGFSSCVIGKLRLIVISFSSMLDSPGLFRLGPTCLRPRASAAGAGKPDP